MADRRNRLDRANWFHRLYGFDCLHRLDCFDRRLVPFFSQMPGHNRLLFHVESNGLYIFVSLLFMLPLTLVFIVIEHGGHRKPDLSAIRIYGVFCINETG